MTGLQRMSRGREIWLTSTSKPVVMHHPKDKPAWKHQSSSSRTVTVTLASTGAAPMPREPKPPAVRGPLGKVEVTNKMAKASSQPLQAYLRQPGL